jgi:ABC-type transport system involved in multi-copper enzyme maturation permease subunit
MGLTGAVMGLINIGFAGLIGLLFYGDPNPAANVVPAALALVLAVVAGFAAGTILTWLSSPFRRQ